jgi:AcrR family transcriptional regulator
MTIPFSNGRRRDVRADAERNRAQVLATAMTAFAEDGLSVSVAEIARRAGVGTGTVSRHFPTKESLYEAIVLAKVEEIVARAHELIEEQAPEQALFSYVDYMVQQGADNRGLAEALSSGGFDIDAAAATSPFDLAGAERTLLTNAQAAGAVRSDVTPADLKALVVGCLARERQPADPAARARMVDIVCAGLRT